MLTHIFEKDQFRQYGLSMGRVDIVSYAQSSLMGAIRTQVSSEKDIC